MKKSLSFLTALMLVLAFIFTLNISNVKVSAEELSDEEIVQAELNNITVPDTAIIDFPVVSVSAHGATIKWESNNESVLDVEENGGWVKVTRPTDEDKVVTFLSIANFEKYIQGKILSEDGQVLKPTYKL